MKLPGDLSQYTRCHPGTEERRQMGGGEKLSGRIFKADILQRNIRGYKTHHLCLQEQKVKEGERDKAFGETAESLKRKTISVNSSLMFGLCLGQESNHKMSPCHHLQSSQKL